MTNEELRLLKQKYNKATTLQYDIAEAQKELTNLINFTDNDLKSGYFKALSGFILDEYEWKVQKLLFQKIINFAIDYRKNKIKKLQQQFNEL